MALPIINLANSYGIMKNEKEKGMEMTLKAESLVKKNDFFISIILSNKAYLSSSRDEKIEYLKKSIEIKKLHMGSKHPSVFVTCERLFDIGLEVLDNHTLTREDIYCQKFDSYLWYFGAKDLRTWYIFNQILSLKLPHKQMEVLKLIAQYKDDYTKMKQLFDVYVSFILADQ